MTGGCCSLSGYSHSESGRCATGSRTATRVRYARGLKSGAFCELIRIARGVDVRATLVSPCESGALSESSE
ncbi:hypothetical protein LR48_Vigan02g020300 [Vigna angularis]|uniref:Uncharacterized protein n=1 Tax=Phaseolus angularis TaxID=3914 RepID=A0A0L9TTY8_PHAAN|nr:hypothetical protein LR48_Vigan02g020300 [Vigna angularis]